MRADIVVVMPPRLTFMPGIGQAQEPVCVETLGPDPAVEGFREGIVGRFAGSAEVEYDIMLVGPQVEVLRDELRPLVHPDPLRSPILTRDPFQRVDHVAARQHAGLFQR